jgi:hypothetical protein
MQHVNGHDEKEGIEAIIFIQKMIGIDESQEKARIGWLLMTPSQKKITIDAYRLIKPIYKSK